MALVRSRSTDLFPHGPVPSTTRQLQEALYTLLDDLEKTAFIEALSLYGTRRDIFDLVNSLRKTLNTPVKRQLFPLVRQVIRKGDVDAFDLLTRGDVQQSTLPRPYLYRPHMADLNVMHKQRASSLPRQPRRDRSVESDHLPSSKSSHSTTKRSNRASRSRSPRARMKRGRDDVADAAPEIPLMARENEGELIEMDLGAPGQERSGYGFTIRGGHETGLGVYVSSVDHGSTAHRCGLRAGDLVVEANNINFRNISHEESALLIQAATYLRLVVSRVGKIPGSKTVHEAFQWTDPMGRPVSPPGGWDPQGRSDGFMAEDEGRTRSGTLMLKGSDERKVNVVVERGQGLGLMIRGGKEYGLGIFVSAIDRYSVAENSGLKIGDQILDVNGRSLLNVTHAQAVRLLKSGRHLMMTVKDVGKVPFAKTTIDETGWIESTRVNSYARSVSSRLSGSESPTDSTIFEGFKRGTGNQLMPTSLTTGQQQKELIYDQAKLLLNESEQMTLNYYVTEYEKRTINLTGFAQALYQILNTPAKLTLLSEIRTIIVPKELNTFDQIVLNRELDNSLTEARGRLAPDVISIGSYDSHDVRPQAQRTMFSQPTTTLERSHRMEKLDQPDYNTTFNLRATSRRMGGSSSSLNRAMSRPSRRMRSPSPVSAYQLMVNDSGGRSQPPMETLPRSVKGSAHKKADDPSDDSGVEISGQLMSGSPEFHQSAGAKSKIYQTNSSKKYSSPQRKILSHLQSSNRGEGKYLSERDASNIALQRHRNQIQHQALVHDNYEGGESITGSIEEMRFTNTEPEAKEKSKQNKKGITNSLRHHQERSRSLQRNQKSESRPKSRARSSDPVLSRRQLRHETGKRDIDVNQGRHVIHDSGDIYATVNRRRRDRSQSPVTDTMTKTWASKPGRGPLSRSAPQSHDLHSSSSSTIVNSNARSSVNFNGKSPSSTLKANRSLTSRRQISSLNNDQRRDLSNSRSNQHSYGNTLTIPSNTISPPMSRKSQSSRKQEETEDYQLPPANVLQKLSKTYRSVSPRRPHRSPKISAHSVTSRKRLDSEFFRSKQEEEEDEQRSSYPCSSVESTPRGSNIRPNLIHSQRGENKTNSLQMKSSLQLNERTRNTMERSAALKSDKNNKSNASIPLIKINSKNLPNVDAAFMKSSIRSRRLNMPMSDGGSMNDRLHDRVTISDTPIEIKDISSSINSSFVSERSNYSHRSSNLNGVNTTNIIIQKSRPSGPRPSIEAIKEKAAEKYGDIHLEVIYIYRSKPTLGVAIEGGANTRQPLPKVINVQPGGSAFESGGLKVGHVILEVNGRPAVGLSHLDAARLIAEAFKDKDRDRMELLVTDWFDELLDVIKVDTELLKVPSK